MKRVEATVANDIFGAALKPFKEGARVVVTDGDERAAIVALLRNRGHEWTDGAKTTPGAVTRCLEIAHEYLSVASLIENGEHLK